MGACISCQTKEITPTYTSAAMKARVIFPDGCLQEYGAAQLFDDRRQLGLGETMFLCNADDLEFGGCFVGIGSNQVLQLGQIYFALPKSMLNRRIRPDDMARLAIRASSALAKTGVVAVELLEEKRSTSRGGRTTEKGKAFAPELTAIAE